VLPRPHRTGQRQALRAGRQADHLRESQEVVRSLFAFAWLSPRGVVVQGIHAAGAVAPEIGLAERGLIRILDQIALELPSPPFVAGPLEVAFELAELAFVVVHEELTV